MGKKTFEQYANQLMMGAVMGGAVGATVGFLIGNVSILSHGLQGNGYLRTVSRYMFQMGGSFALFMGVGSVIRNDTFDTKKTQYTPIWMKYVKNE